MGRLFLLFLIVPVVDLAVLVAVGGRLGFLPTLGIVLFTAALGSYLARREGVAAWARVQSRLRAGAMPGPELLDGVMVLVAGVLLLTPGFVTDAIGLVGLFPPTRRLLSRALGRRLQRGIETGAVRVVHAGRMGSRPAEPVVEDAEVIDVGRIEA